MQRPLQAGGIAADESERRGRFSSARQAGCLPEARCLARYASLVGTASIPGARQGWTRRLLRCGVAAGPVFVAVFLFEGAVREGYRPLRHPVSSLALGSRGWIQAANFAVAGTLFLAAAKGLARTGGRAATPQPGGRPDARNQAGFPRCRSPWLPWLRAGRADGPGRMCPCTGLRRA